MSIFTAGGIVLIPIIICGLIAAFIVVERFVYFRAIDKRDEKFKKDIDIYLTRHDYLSAESASSNADTPTAQVIKKAIQSKKLIEADMREMVQCELDVVVPQFEHWIGFLGTVANAAMLFGLLGTVIGIIEAFGVLGDGGGILNQESLALAIAHALVTTAAGLCVAIPSFVFSSFLEKIVDSKISEMERFVTGTVLRLTGRIL